MQANPNTMDTMKRMLLLPGVLLLALTTFELASGTDIWFYNGAGCDGAALACYDIDSAVCCTVPPSTASPMLAVSFVDIPCISGSAYAYGGCDTLLTGYEDACFDCDIACTGAAWFSCRRRQLLGATNDAKDDDWSKRRCKKTISPNAVVYTDKTTRVTWVLIQEDGAQALYEELNNVPNAEKLDWFKARGATLSKGV